MSRDKYLWVVESIRDYRIRRVFNSERAAYAFYYKHEYSYLSPIKRYY